jgi:DNA-binding NarL/FixJ family response regulator
MKLPTTILADDHAMLVDGLGRLLEGHADVIATCMDGGTLLETTRRLRPELVITDISMPVMTGMEFLRAVHETYRPRVIVLSMFTQELLVAAAFKAGAMGYIPKHAAGEELIDAVNDVMAGRRYLSRLLSPVEAADRTAATTSERPYSLSKRQREVLRLVATGKTMKEVASALHLSRRTVEMHKYNMMRSLGLGTTAELIQYFVKHEALAEALEQPSLEL